MEASTRDASVPDAAPAQDSSAEFFRLLRFTRLTPIPRTLQEMVDASTVIALARVVSVRDGRVIDFATGASNPIHTAVLELDLERVLKGERQERAYVEYIRGGVTPESLDEAVPNQRMLVMLYPADGWDQDVYVFEGAGRGVGEGHDLLELVDPMALMVEQDGQVVHPLAHDPTQRLLGDASSLGEAAEMLQQLAAGG